MAWRQPGDKPLSEQMMLVYWRIYASLGLNESSSTPLDLMLKTQMACDKHLHKNIDAVFANNLCGTKFNKAVIRKEGLNFTAYQ